MSFQNVSTHRHFRPALGAVLTALCGLLLWARGLESWENASYDNLHRFGGRGSTNQVVLILMDYVAHKNHEQPRGQPWSRALHADLLNRLADDRCPLVVLDIHFDRTNDPAVDGRLAGAMQRLDRVVLMADQEVVDAGPIKGTELQPPVEPFLSAARSVFGLGKVEKDPDNVVRRHWRFPGYRSYPNLPWVAAQQANADLRDLPEARWLRFYAGPEREAGAAKPGGWTLGNLLGTAATTGRPWTALSYDKARDQPSGFFSNNIVFVGNDPETLAFGDEPDEFLKPHPEERDRAVGGVKFLATEFLNLLHGDWLRRPAGWVEASLLILGGLALGAGLGRVGRWTACALGTGAGVAVLLGAVCLSFFTDYWFPWLYIVGGQIPCAVLWAFAVARPQPAAAGTTNPDARTELMPQPAPGASAAPYPDATDYEVVTPSFGKGAYGEVWVVRNSVGQWQALKAINERSFEQAEPYQREWRGITNYKPVSDQHPGLLRIDFVSKRRPEGYFYYVMELGDPETPGWEQNPGSYRPLNLHSLCARAPGRRLPARRCAEIGLALADTLAFLHARDLTHRDIKPSNIIFVNGRPKLADVGLVTEVRPGEELTWVGTAGYMPPAPEPPGTKIADLYALGMVLYVISTGRPPTRFPELSTTLVEKSSEVDFLRLNPIILKACEPDASRRYATADEMRADLEQALAALTPPAQAG